MNGWAWRFATEEDAAHVFDHVWERGAVELAAFEVDRAGWLCVCREMIALDCCMTFLRDGIPQAIVGVRRHAQVGRTWFQAVEGINMTGLTRYMRRAIALLVATCRVNVTELHSLCVAPEAPRWYRFLGFKEDNSYNGKAYGPLRERRFIQVWG